MTKLFLTTCFHGNLGYSSIPKSRIKEVIDKCYWPIVSLVDQLDIKLGFEFPAQTLEYIQEEDDKLIEKLKELWRKKKIEIVGSGYVQSIFPLIPADVNIKNLEIGNKIYKEILGQHPIVALVNEQCFSVGLISLYKIVGYKAVIVDWPNAYKYNNLPKDYVYRSFILKGLDTNILAIWNDSIIFQKFQRYVYGDMTIKEYLKEILSNYHKNEDRTFMIYGNDMEVFNFRSRDPKILHSGGIKADEIAKIKDVFKALKENPRTEFILPSESLRIKFKIKISIETAEYPIITKKQDKYNVCRWAVCGNNNWKSNTLCYKAYHLLKELNKIKAKSETDVWWKKLVELWASDFRTHTEKLKYKEFSNNLIKLIFFLQKELEKNGVKKEKELRKKGNKKGFLLIDQDKNLIETEGLTLKLNLKKGGTIEELRFNEISKKPFIKLLKHGYYKDITYGVDLFSGHTIIFSNNKKITDLSMSSSTYKQIGNNCLAKIMGEIDGDTFIKEYLVYSDRPQVDIHIEFDFKKKISPIVFRSFILTLNPDCFDKRSLYYKTVNGGFDYEKFFVKKNIDQSTPVDFNITSKHCLGSTDEWLSIGDEKKELIIKTNKGETYSVPLLEFKKIKKDYLFRVYNSVCETDETTNAISFKGKIKFSYSLTAKKN